MAKLLAIQYLFEDYVKKFPNHIAIIYDQTLLTYKKLNQRSNQLAHYLINLNLKKNSLIAVSVPLSPDQLIAVMGILKSGGAYVPVDDTHPMQRLQYILDETEAQILITHSSLAAKFNFFNKKIIFIDKDWDIIKLHSSSNPTRPVSTQDLAYVIYTSGSTGSPKGVLIRHDSLFNYIKWLQQYIRCRAQTRVDFSSNLIFDMAVTTSIAALAIGWQVIICPLAIKRNLPAFIKCIDDNKINLIKITPSYFKLMLQEILKNYSPLSDLHTIILGGEILLTADCRQWLDIYPRHHLINEYGPTETTVAVTQYGISHTDIDKLGPIIPIGKPGPNINCVVLDAHKKMVLPGNIGELYISGVCVAAGYLKQPVLTTANFIQIASPQQVFYATKDLCRELPDGNLEYIARIDDQIKIQGYRIEPHEIELQLRSHPLIENAVVVTGKGYSGDVQLHAYFIPQDKKNYPDGDELRSYLRKYLADYMLPAKFKMLESFPLTLNGKIDKKQLLNVAGSVIDKINHATSIFEKKIIAILCDIFGVSEIGINSNFFELGGNSLIAAKFIYKVADTLGKKITFEQIYKSPMVQQIAKVIQHAPTIKDNNIRLDSITWNSNTLPLSDFQLLFWLSNLFTPKVKKLNIIARKRVFGKLDMIALKFAFTMLVKKHQILSCQTATWLPYQYLNQNLHLAIQAHDLASYDQVDREKYLANSLKTLLKHYPWKSNKVLIIAEVFYLGENSSELQISAPHIIFDDASIDILFAELSQAYLLYKNNLGQSITKKIQPYEYVKYTLYENKHLNQQLDRDIYFWQTYLTDTSLLVISAQESFYPTGQAKPCCSTYVKLPENFLYKIKSISINAHVTIADLLCAATAISLKKYVGHLNHNKILFNVIRSMRDHEVFDKMIGCFLRIDPVKIDVTCTADLITLSKYIQQSRLIAEPYQACSSMVKLACLEKKPQYRFIKIYIINTIATICAWLFKKLLLNPGVVGMYGRLSCLKQANSFIVNINISNQFIYPKLQRNLFGFKVQKAKIYKYDLCAIAHVLDLCFLRDPISNQAYLVISAHLTNKFRQQLGQEIVKQIMSTPHS